MASIVTIGLDIAKSVFQVHGIDGEGQVVVQKRLTRRKLLPFFERLSPCLVGLEACAAAHHWGRELSKLGHDVRLIAAKLREAIRQAAEERRCRCRGDLRSSSAANHALRRDQEP